MEKSVERKLYDEVIEMPQGVSVSYSDDVLSLRGVKGQVTKRVYGQGVGISVDGSRVTISYFKGRKGPKKNAGTVKAHLRNMLRGVTEGFSYRLKICSGHFPMNVSVSGDELVVKNFFGEKYARKLRIAQGVKVRVDGQELFVESSDRDAASQCAASIEQLTRRSKFDRRVFMDGIYITSKGSGRDD
ncbi:50S ribosomal protein L6 [Candidatus Woesearchaeota archaeon]|nr:50S ribosomal protein L6 [Candidatus Woesearchaeota archaeon]